MDIILHLYIVLTTLVLRPFLTVLFHVFNFIPFIKKRLTFERKNFADNICAYRDHLQGSITDKGLAFLVSSEGEFEQVVPLIEAALENDHAIELVYTSPSVEKKISTFVQLKKSLGIKNIFALRLPLVSFFPFDFFIFQSPFAWLKSKTIVFCRYDFFPELLFFYFLKRRLILVSATLKNKKISAIRSLYLKSFYKLFALIIPATSKDQITISNLSNSKKCQAPFDFRVSRIIDRLEQGQHNEDMAKWSKINGDRSLILGSLWPSDLAIVLSKEALNFYAQNNWSLFIYPHKLGDESFVSTIRNLIALSRDLDFVAIKNLNDLKKIDEFKKSTVYYLDIGGILVESYQFFHWAYVGGGFERSIHSVLEPYVAKAAVITGEKTYRSTEWDLINQDVANPGGISVSTSAEYLNALNAIILSKNSIGGSKNYQSLIQWNREKINQLVKTYFK